MREGWTYKKLGDLFDIGSSKRVYESQWRSTGVPFYRAREIVKLSRDGFVDNELFVDEDLYKAYTDKYGTPKCGDIMVTGVGTLGVCYVVKENDRFYFKDGNILWFKTKEGTNPFFVKYAFKSNYLRQQIDNCNGATVGTFTIVRAKETSIPIPPIEEQERIVAELDLLSSVIEKKKAQLKEYDQLAQSIFYDMFGDPIDNPKGWEVKKLNDLSSLICNGNTPKGGSEVYVEKGFLFLRSQNVWKNRLELDDVAFIDEETHSKLKKSALRHNDLLITKTGRINTDNSSLGRTALFEGEDGSANINGHVYLVRLKQGVLHKFILYILISNSYRELIRKTCVGGIDKRQLNRDHIQDFPIILPPRTLQQSFVEKVEEIEKQKALVQASIVETETLFNSRMDYYFN